MPDLYIPPTGFQFRLVNKYTNNVIFAKNDGLNDYSGGTIYDDQWFTLEDAGESNKYYIKSTYGPNGGKVIYAKSSGVGIYNKEYADQRMVLEAGTGDMLGSFRIRNDYSGMVIASQGSKDLVSYHSDESKYPDQYWQFYFEDTEIDRVEYAIDKGTITGTGPGTPMITWVRNEDSRPATLTGHVGGKYAETSTFTYSVGFSIAVGAKASFGVPGIAGGEISTQYTILNNYEWSKTSSWENNVGADVATEVPGHMRKEIVGSINRSTLNVPCTVYSKSKKTGTEVITKAEYKGTPVWGFGYTVKEAVPL